MPVGGLRQYGYDPGTYTQALMGARRRFTDRLGQNVEKIATGIAGEVQGAVQRGKQKDALENQYAEMYMLANDVTDIIASDTKPMGAQFREGKERGIIDFSSYQPDPESWDAATYKQKIQQLNTGLGNIVRNVAGSNQLSEDTLNKLNARFTQAGMPVDLSKPIGEARTREEVQGFVDAMAQPRQVQMVPPQEAGPPAPEVMAAAEQRRLGEGQVPLPTPPTPGVTVEAPRTEQGIMGEARRLGLTQEQIESPHVQQQIQEATARDKAKQKARQEVGEKLSNLESTVQKELSDVTANTIAGKEIAIEYSMDEAGDLIKEKEKSLKAMMKNIRSNPEKALAEAQKLGIEPTLEAAQGYADEIMQQKADLDAEKKAIQERLKALQARFAEEAEKERKTKPRTYAPGTVPARGQDAIDQLMKRAFPAVYNVGEGVYGTEEMQRLAGIPGLSISSDPKKRLALAYNYPDVAAILRETGLPEPSKQEQQQALKEMQALQKQIYSALTPSGLPAGGETTRPDTLRLFQ